MEVGLCALPSILSGAQTKRFMSDGGRAERVIDGGHRSFVQQWGALGLARFKGSIAGPVQLVHAPKVLQVEAPAAVGGTCSKCCFHAICAMISEMPRDLDAAHSDRARALSARRQNSVFLPTVAKLYLTELESTCALSMSSIASSHRVMSGTLPCMHSAVPSEMLPRKFAAVTE